MALITEEHLHHMARRHHAVMKKYENLSEEKKQHIRNIVSTVETTAASWLGGVIEGRTSGRAILNIPINFGVGAILLAVGHFDLAGDKVSSHLSNLGDGLIGSYLAATGFAFGKHWRESGHVLGGGSQPWLHPYQGEVPPPPVHGDLSHGQMAAIVERMQQAAAAPAHP